MDPWRPIDSAPKDGTEVLVSVTIADEQIVRNAFYVDEAAAEVRASFEDDPAAAAKEGVGWWCYTSSITQTKLEGIYEPTHWYPMPGNGLVHAPLYKKMALNYVTGSTKNPPELRLMPRCSKGDLKPWLSGDLGISFPTIPTGENLRASSLIQALQSLMEVHGDLKVGIFNPEFSSFNACDRVIVKEATHSDFGDDDQLEGLFFGLE